MTYRAKRPSGFSQYRILLAKDLKQEFRTKEMFVSMGIYAVLVIIVFGVALSFIHPGQDFLPLSGGLLWSMIIFTSLMGLNRSFSHERQNGCLEGLLLAPMDRGAIFLAKATSNFIFLLGVEIVAIPLFWVFFSSSVAVNVNVIPTVIPIFLGSVGIAAVGTLLSTITANIRGKDVMLAVLFVPIVFPLLYACVSATTAVLAGTGIAEALWIPAALMIGYDVIMILVAWVLYDFIISV